MTCKKDHRSTQRAFTLVEVLVALAIVSVALLAALRTAGLGTTHSIEHRARLLAGWVAENRLAEHRANAAWLSTGITRGTQTQSGTVFYWREEVIASPNPAFRQLDIYVFTGPEENQLLARFTDFSVNPPGAN